MFDKKSNEPEGFDWNAAEAQLVNPPATVAETDPDEPPVPVDSPEAQQAPKAVTAGKRPIVPDWARSRDSINAEVKRVVNLGAHTIGYHAIRLPKYAAKLAVRAPIGAARLAGRTNRWLWDDEGRPARAATAERGDYEAYRKLVMIRDRHVRWRGMIVAAGLMGSLVGAATLLAIGGPMLWAALGAATLGLGWAGRPGDKPLLDTAVVKTSLAPLTSEVVIRGLSVLGIAGINQAMAKSSDAIGFTAPIQRDGPGWRAEIDLPWGVTAGEVADKRDKLASGLKRPLGCVWPEGRPEITPGRLVIWVGDEDMATSKQARWPLMKSGTVDLFKPFAFGTDPRGRWAQMDLMYTNVLIGSIPGMGKTFSMRLPLLGAALDPRAELWVYELKGTGDLEPISKVAHRYASGADDPEIEQALQALRDLRAECSRRAKVIKDLPK
ncbi:MAG: cell division protein FtsK, partial [Stackebrandtia sp.]